MCLAHIVRKQVELGHLNITLLNRIEIGWVYRVEVTKVVVRLKPFVYLVYQIQYSTVYLGDALLLELC